MFHTPTTPGASAGGGVELRKGGQVMEWQLRGIGSVRGGALAAVGAHAVGVPRTQPSLEGVAVGFGRRRG